MKKKVKEMDMPKDDKKKNGAGKAVVTSHLITNEEVDEHMNALVAGQDDLSEEFKSKALATVFESNRKLLK